MDSMNILNTLTKYLLIVPGNWKEKNLSAFI